MTKVKVFVYRRRRRQQRRHLRRRGYDNSSPDFRHGELKMKWLWVKIPGTQKQELSEDNEVRWKATKFK